jgi:hypothetical protein
MRRGRLIAQGSVAELRGQARDGYDLSVRGDEPAFLARLKALGVSAETLAPGKYRVLDAQAGAESTPASDGEDADSPAEPALPLDSTRAPLSERILRAADASGVQLRALRPMTVTLEDAFVHALAEAAEAS